MNVRYLVVLFFLSGCSGAGPTDGAIEYRGMSTASLWHLQQATQSPMELSRVEAELGARGQTRSGLWSLGDRTLSTFGKPVYDRSVVGADQRNCADFESSAHAQRYFLAFGGPLSDPHDLDRDGDGLACEWGTYLRQARTLSMRITQTPRSVATCITGPRGGTYTITASGGRNYDGC